MIFIILVDFIQEDVTDKVHLTIFYGLRGTTDIEDIKDYLEKIKNIKKCLKIKKLVLLEGYKGLYKIIVLEIDDEDKT
ncbi:MAG: hypothetical protein N3A71_01350 [Candidatus Dojkabacteria bacterium]|nr:hypothetical protein [Candidatus Dojkabacteria bacterium]